MRRPPPNILLEMRAEWTSSCDQVRHKFRRHDSGKFLFQPLEFVGEPGVVHAKKAKDGGVEVAHMDRILDYVIAEIVSLAVNVAGLGAAAGHPGGEAARMVVAAVVVFG